MTNLIIIPKEPKPESVQHKIGNWYRDTSFDSLFLLASVDNKAALVRTDGVYNTKPIICFCPWPTVSEEIFQACCGSSKFKLVENITITEG